MKVSIITPVFNAERFLEKTFESVLGQTYENWEWILVDDCSQDSSLELLKSFQLRDERIKVFRNEINRGAGWSRNYAIQNSIGRFIAFLDSDDLWVDRKLDVQIKFMIENNVHFSHTSYGYIDEEGSRIKSTFRVSPVVDYVHLLKRTEISCLTAVYDADKIGKHYMSLHARKQDYALWLSILKLGIKSYGIDEELAYYRQVKGSATSNKFKLIAKHVSFLKDSQGFTSIKALYYTGYWMINGFVRYFIK